MKRISMVFISMALILSNAYLANAAEPKTARHGTLTINQVDAKASADTIDLKSSEGDDVFHVEKQPILILADFASASVSANGRTVLQVTLSDQGALKLQKFTKGHVGEKMAMIADGQLIAAPVIRDSIKGKNFQVDAFNQADAKNIVQLINEQTK